MNSPKPPNITPEQAQATESYIQMSLALSQLTDTLDEVNDKTEPILKLHSIITEQLQDAGIKITDTDSLLGQRLKDLKKNNQDWKSDSKEIVSALKSLSTKMWGLIVVLTVSLGVGLLDRFEDPKQNTVEKHYYHLPPETKWHYDGTQLFTVVDGDTLYKKP